MKRVKYLLLCLGVAGLMTACGKTAETAEEVTTVEEVTSEAASTEETTTEEATSEEASTVEEDVDDATHNYQQIVALGLNEADAQAAAEYFDHIYFGKVKSNNRLEVGNSVYIELANEEENVLVLSLADDRIKEILDADLNIMTAIAEVEEASTEAPKEEAKQTTPKKQEQAAPAPAPAPAPEPTPAPAPEPTNNTGIDGFIPGYEPLPEPGYGGTFGMGG